MSEIRTGVIKTYRVEYADGTTAEVTTGMPDALRWERNNDGRGLLGENSLTVLMTLIYYALRRHHLTDAGHFDDWQATVVDFVRLTGDNDDEVGPTSRDRSDD